MTEFGVYLGGGGTERPAPGPNTHRRRRSINLVLWSNSVRGSSLRVGRINSSHHVVISVIRCTSSVGG